MRHAESGWATTGQRDFDRSLSEKGFAEAVAVADIAGDRNYAPDIVLCSTAVRCRETADAIRRVLSVDTEFRFVDELYNATLDTYLAILSAQTESRSVMIIGHNPTIEDVVETLAGLEAAHEAAPLGFPTAGLAVLDWRESGTDGSKPGWLLTDMITA